MKFLLLVCAASTLSGCRFWYKPVPVANAIGEEKAVVSGDTMNVHRDARFEVYGPNAEAVYDGYEQLNRAYRSFERYFGASAARLAVVLSADSGQPLDSAAMRSFRERGFTLLRYVRPRSFRNPSRYGALGYGGVVWPIAPTAARSLLARYAAAQLDVDRMGVNSALLDRFPLWFRAAVIHMVGEGGASENDLEYVRDRRALWLPLRELLTLVRPAAADSMLDPSRRSEADELTRLIAAQATTFGRFLVEREGPAVIGRLARGYLSGRSINEMIAEFHTAPRTLQDIEQRWKGWIETREY